MDNSFGKKGWLVNNPKFIAEAGVNHNGSLDIAKKLVIAARNAGASAVKFQTWLPGEITGKYAYKVDYLKASSPASETRYELSNRLRLTYDDFRQLKDYCAEKEIEFLSTPDGFDSLDFLVDELKMEIVKVGSSELNHLRFLEAVGAKKLPVILSTGIGTLGEVETAIGAIRRGGGEDIPITILHCTSNYPCQPEEVNLRAMISMSEVFKMPVGLSDHTSGMEAAVAAVACGAEVIEKHFTLDRAMNGPDHAASIDPDGLALLIEKVNIAAKMIGDGIKKPQPSELLNKDGIRRSVVAVEPLKKGTRLKNEHLICKRPGTGIAPSQLTNLVGLTLTRDLDQDEPLQWSDFW